MKKQIKKFRKVKSQVAEKEIADFILKNKKKGCIQMNIWDIAFSLNLPPAQTEQIIEKFEKKGLAKKVSLGEKNEIRTRYKNQKLG